jgi:hypothetical protein
MLTALITATATAVILAALALGTAFGHLRVQELVRNGRRFLLAQPRWSTRRERAELAARLWVP